MVRSLGAVALVVAAITGCATASTDRADPVAGTSAELHGRVISTVGGTVEYWAEYGPTPSYGSATEHREITGVPVNQSLGVSVRVDGLDRATTYHYRLCAQDSEQEGGPGCGEDRTFTTVNLDCGDVVTRDTVLSGPLACPRTIHDEPALRIGADGVDLDLGGHELHGGLLNAEGGTAIENEGHDDVTVRNGYLHFWGEGLVLRDASRNRVLDLEVSAFAGLTIDAGEQNTVRRYALTGIGRGGHAFSARSDGLVLTGSYGLPFYGLAGDGMRIADNHLDGFVAFGFSAACLVIRGNHNRVVDNQVGGCESGGIVLRAGAGNALIGNETFGSHLDFESPEGEPDGIRVEPFTTDTLLRDNFARDNADDGIEVLAPGTTLRRNTANRNGDFGIDAASGVVDAGGNRAAANGNPLQCRNVVCR